MSGVAAGVQLPSRAAAEARVTGYIERVPVLIRGAAAAAAVMVNPELRTAAVLEMAAVEREARRTQAPDTLLARIRLARRLLAGEQIPPKGTGFASEALRTLTEAVAQAVQRLPAEL